MPRPRKPSNVLELNGAFKHNPDRKRATVKAAHGVVGDPPEHFDEIQRREYAEIVRLAPPGVLKPSDAQSVALLATLMAEFHQAPYAFNAAKYGATLKLLQQFAMTPSSRENFSVKTDEEPQDELREFRA
jgi:hypothetical protein